MYSTNFSKKALCLINWAFLWRKTDTITIFFLQKHTRYMSRIPQAALDKKVWRDQQDLGCNTASPQVGKTNKTFLSTATSKKMPGQQKQQSAAPKMPPGCSNPFFIFWDSNVLKWEFTVKSMDWTNSLTRAIFFLDDVSVWCAIAMLSVIFPM